MPKRIKKAKVEKLLQNARKAGETAENSETPIAKEAESGIRPCWYPEPSASLVLNKKKRRGAKGKKKLPAVTPIQAGSVDIAV